MEITIRQFIRRYQEMYPQENPQTIENKIYQWVRAGHLPAYKVPNEDGILVTTADPEKFQGPKYPGPVPPGEGLRVSEVARRLKMSRQTVYNRLKKRGIDGGRVPQELLQEWESGAE